jgi:hypothetical protein
LADYAKWLPLEAMKEVQEQLCRAMADEEVARMIGLENDLDQSMAWVDSTCLKANIHFPRSSHSSREVQRHQKSLLKPRNLLKRTTA